jgi:hypothetical protein
MPRAPETFRNYLESLPDELLESVTEDYVWLSGLNFNAARTADFRRRRECCREECLRRGLPAVSAIPASPRHNKIALQFQIHSV